MRHSIHRIHFIGVGGVGMAGLAEVMQDMGFSVSGSDAREQPTLTRLRQRGVRVLIGHDAATVQDADCVVYSSAVSTANVEREAAVAKGIPVVPRAQMLGELMRFKPGIAVAGTHGKTTTASMVAAVLNAAELSPTCVIGGRLLDFGRDNLLGEGDYVVVEADESDASFLHLQPQVAVITNMDNDHLEAFDDDMNALTAAFAGFLGNLPFYGAAVLCVDDAPTRALAATLKTPRCIRYGFDEEADFRAANVQFEKDGMGFDLLAAGECQRVFVRAYGRHNVQNALAAAAVAREVGAPMTAVVRGLAAFGGVGRRLQHYGEITVAGKTVLLIDDYAHHPTEISATINALRGAYHERRLLLVFQPHRYSRTRRLLESLALSVAAADVVLLLAVYAAGEKSDAAVADDLFAAIPSHVNKVFCDDLAAVPMALAELVQDGDLLVTMGAGNVGGLAAQLAAGGADG